MSKRTERMSRSAAERINRKDIVIRQNNAELEELRSQYEKLYPDLPLEFPHLYP